MASVRFREIGKLCKPHGLKGEIKVFLSAFDYSLFREISSVYLSPKGGVRKELQITGVRPQGKFVVTRFQGLDRIEDVESLVGNGIELPEADFPTLPEGEYYHFQILGLEVVTESGDHLGPVVDIIETGSNDVYEVELGNGTTVLLPVIEDVVRKVDLTEKKIIIHVMEGLLDGD